jgi:ATP-binding cassette, subfamily C, bacterial
MDGGGPMSREGNPNRALRNVIAEMLRIAPRQAALGVVLLVGLTLTEGAGLLLLGPILERVVVIEENPLPRAGGWLEGAFGAVGLDVTLGSVLALFVAIAGARALVQNWRARVMGAVRDQVVDTYRSRLHRAIAAAEWRYLVTRAPSHFVHALTGEVGRVGQVVNHLTELAVAVLVSMVYFGLALRVAPLLALLVMAAAVLLAFAVRGGFEQARTLGEDSAVMRRRLHQVISEQMASLKTARVYGAVERHLEEVDRLAREARDVSYTGALADSRFQQSLEFGSTALLATVVYVAATVLLIPPALLLVLMFVFARLMPRVIQIYRIVRSLRMSLPIVDDLETRIRECTAAAEVPAQPVDALDFRSDITFDSVAFWYLRRGDRAAVSGLNLRIAAGMTTAIVGASGSGKSTVADLLTGLLTPSAGQIRIDGRPLTGEAMASWRAQIGFVPQDTFLFHDTVRANLAWARSGATEEELWEALRLAAADGFVAELPAGLDTIIGERGVLLSGGERQRLAIARALLRRPSLLVLDEATSSLDVEHERRIQDAIDALHHRVTLVIITHRLTTIRHADIIHVMADGAIVQSGTWSQLQQDLDGPFQTFARRLALAGDLA